MPEIITTPFDSFVTDVYCLCRLLYGVFNFKFFLKVDRKSGTE